MNTILCAVDFSDVATRVASVAGTMAMAFDARVVLLHVAPPEPSFVSFEPGPQSERDFRAAELRQEHRDLQTLAEALEAEGVTVEPLMVPGATVEKILDEAERLEADVVVLGSHGHSALYDLLVGSVAEGVMRKAKCPVLIVPAKTE